MPISFSSLPSDLSSLSADELRDLVLQQHTLLAQTQAVVSQKEKSYELLSIARVIVKSGVWASSSFPV